MKHYNEYDIWRLTILLYVDFSTEMVRRHVTSGKGNVQRKYKKYAYDEFDIWFSTRIQSIINVICGKSVEFCDYKDHYFRSISSKLSAAWEKRTNESLIENFLFFMMMSIPLWIMSSSLHASKLLALKKPSLIMLFSFAHPCHGGVATSSLQGPPHCLECK